MPTKSLKEQLRVYERTLLVQALQVYPTRREAAKGLNISLRSLFYKLRLHGIPGCKKSVQRQKLDTCAVRKSGASC